jgi:hypothetical protein
LLLLLIALPICSCHLCSKRVEAPCGPRAPVDLLLLLLDQQLLLLQLQQQRLLRLADGLPLH